MKISYAITCFNEIEETKRLTQFLFENIRPQDEVVILMDDKGPDEMWNYLISIEPKLGALMRFQFNNDFAEWKNRLSAGCWGDYIFNIDADEIPSLYLINNLPSILENNSIDLAWVPRINTLIGDEDEIKSYVKSQRWSMNDKGWINWPNDYQGRIYRKNPNISWVGKVHEKIEGHKSFAFLPSEEHWSLLHPKTLNRQIKQNELYSKL
jgi:hypothetical protein